MTIKSVTLAFILLPLPLHAIGILYTGVGGGGREVMELTEASVQVRIQDRVAVTRMDQVFTNHSGSVVEGIYEFQLPDGAIITELVLWIEGQPVKGIVMEKEEGRAVYDAIVRRRIDPALVEQIEEDRFRLSIFPFPAAGSRRVELEYLQVLEARDGRVDYTFPLAPETDQTMRIERFLLRAEIDGQHPFEVRVGGVPAPIVDIQRPSDRSSQVFVGDEQLVPEENLTLTIRELGVRPSPAVLSYAPVGPSQPGYFALWLPPLEALSQAQPTQRSIIFLIDISSSMRGEKLRAVKAALTGSIEELNDGDWFNVVVFSNEAHAFAASPVEASVENKAAAVRFVNQQGALGLSNFEQAFTAAMGQTFPGGRANQAIFLTDGYATLGETDPLRLSDIVTDLAPAGTRVFGIGVGHAVDRDFLRILSADHQGEARFVSAEGELEVALRSLFAELTQPVFVTDQAGITYSGTQVMDVFPREVGLLAAGREVFQVGRYEQGGDFALHLNGSVNGEALNLDFPLSLTPTDMSQPLIPRLWAQQKVWALEALIDRYGPNEELLEDILQLGLTYQIVTRRTSLFAPDEQVVVNPEVGEDEDDRGGARTAVEEEARVEVMWMGRAFYLLDEVWVDVQYESTMVLETYDDSPGQPEELRDFARLGQEMIVVSVDRAFRISRGILPAAPVLSQNMPNPFNATTVIRLQIPMEMAAAGMRMTVHNLLGQMVREFPLDDLRAGENRMVWDGRDDDGQSVASGVYICRLTGAGTVASRRMLLLR